jgi:Bacterial mobilisation protein (MobC).
MKTIKTGGRPTKELGEKRSYMVSIKLDTREYYSLKVKANSAGISRSEYIRQCIVGSVICPRLTPEMNDYIRKLSGMGNNLNQIARRANAEGYTNARNEYFYLADKIDKVIEMIEDDGKNSKR